MPSPKIVSPGSATNTTRAINKVSDSDCTWFREAVAIAVVGLLLAVVMTDAVVGMSSGFAPTHEAVGMMAGVGDHE
jgi:hypothetical protein